MSSTVALPYSQTKDSYHPQARFDLKWIFYPAEHNWVAHDPVSGEFYRLNEYEYAAYRLMNGSRSFTDLLKGMKERFGPIRVDLEWVQDFVQRLHSSMLLQPTQTNLRSLQKHSQRVSKLRTTTWLNSPLSIRIPIFDPGSFLDWCHAPASLLFSRTLGVVVALMGLLVSWLMFRWSLASGIPQWNPSRITIDRWLLLFLSYGAVKSLHELGHLLACARYKVRSSEVGIMLLCLIPCFYCDTTQAWKLASKWQRALISAAGIYVELIIAIIAALGWLILNDGTLSLICLNLAIICSVSTLFLNANPLLRYDGYYILSDLWGVPNLHEQSRTALKYMFSRCILLQPATRPKFDANPMLLSLFAILSWLYRVFVMLTILWMIWTILPPMGLRLLSVIVTASIVAGIAISQTRFVLNTVGSIQRMDRSNRAVATAIWMLLILGLIGFLFVPLPHQTIARGYVDYSDKSPIYATYDARIQTVAKTYSRLNKGSLVIRLESPSAQLEMAQLNGEIQRAELGLEQRKLRRTIDPEAEYQIPQLEADLSRLRARFSVLDREYSQLEYYAPSDGYLIDSLSRPAVDLTSSSDSSNRPTILEKENLGGWVKRSALLGWFSALRAPVVVAVLPEASMQGVVEGGLAYIRLDGQPFDAIPGRITHIATSKLSNLPNVLVGDPTLVSIPKRDGGFETETPHYAVTIALDSERTPLYEAVATISIPLPAKPVHEHISDFFHKSIRPVNP